jgi:peptidoglycan L-alanyl-D-glutamate endopeptidase CwlK
MGLPFSTKSKEKLAQAHPILQKFFEYVNSEIQQCTILSGGRTIEQQRDFVNGTNLTGINPEKKVLSKTMDSNHLIQPDGFSHAVDVAPDPVEFEKPGYKLNLIYFAGKVMEAARRRGIKLRYGGDWNKNNEISDESFQDTDHFELSL